MAYNYYQPMGYASPMYQMPQAQPTNSIVWVEGYNEAAMYPVAPNAAVALWDKSTPSIYLKKADATGRPSITIYDLVERKERKDAQDVHYATQDDLRAVSKAVQELEEGLKEVRLKMANKASEEVVENA